MSFTQVGEKSYKGKIRQCKLHLHGTSKKPEYLKNGSRKYNNFYNRRTSTIFDVETNYIYDEEDDILGKIKDTKINVRSGENYMDDYGSYRNNQNKKRIDGFGFFRTKMMDFDRFNYPAEY